ncbi:MAG: hypothetical protein U0805_01010 [Pirellulales bacterium]
MRPNDRNPLLAAGAVFLIALSHSIGWGIRGNFGHEAGAMIAGALSALAIAALSNRDDWRNRAAYFAMFGALGWAFGGSIAYMYPISFTESGEIASTYYGYFSLFVEGGLWAGLGAAGTAFAAAMPLDRLKQFFTPLCFVLVALGLKLWIEAPLEGLLMSGSAGLAGNTWHRHASPLYWFDADWFAAAMALVGVCAFELYDRKNIERDHAIDHPLMLLPFAAVGAALGYVGQAMLHVAGLDDSLRRALVVKLGDLNYISPNTSKGFDQDQLLTNWPNFFSYYPQHVGWWGGLVAGVALYFILTGRFRNDASLLLYLALGWLLAFIAMPVLGSTLLMDYGGFRLMPPRSDDWAGIVGVFLAALIWSRRYGVPAIANVASLGFLLGGLSFATVPALRFILRYPGNPWRFPQGVPEPFAHYQSANWHSILEQSHGFGHGLAIAIAMAMLWRRQAYDAREGRVGNHWTVAFSVFFVWCIVGFLNMYKLVETWVEKKAVPATLKAPLLGFIEAPAEFWFCLVWWTAAAVCGWLLLAHRRRRFEIVPTTWTGKAQLIYVVFLALVVVGNLSRAIPGFTNGRMVTEWAIFMNASLATLLIMVLPGPNTFDSSAATSAATESRLWPSLLKTWGIGLVAVSVLLCVYGWMTLALYQHDLEGKPWANHRRFGPDAKWRIEPILKNGEHP